MDPELLQSSPYQTQSVQHQKDGLEYLAWVLLILVLIVGIIVLVMELTITNDAVSISVYNPKGFKGKLGNAFKPLNQNVPKELSSSTSSTSSAKNDGEVIKLTDITFQELVPNKEALVFFHSNCPHCVKFEPEFDKAASENETNIPFYKVHVKDAREAFETHKITSVPSILKFKQNGESTKFSGERTKAGLHQFVKSK